jgi:signal transduction histidine kinase
MMITSYASLELAVKATNIGAYDFVPKPFTPQELKASMENITKHYFLRRMTRKLHKEGKIVRFKFLTLLSHELKSPLNAIEGYLKLMQEKQAGEKIDDYQDMIDRSLSRVKSMRALIMDLLDLTRIDSGKKKRDLRELDIELIAKSAMDGMTPLAVQRDVKLILDIEEQQPLMADAEEMEIIFNNLISNAVKYNKDGGSVKCVIRSTSSEMVIKVIDTGFGIEADDIPKLFQEFSRIKNASTRNISGSGLGLSIVKKLVDLYNGHIDVESVPGEGTTFTLRFPILPSLNEIAGLA